MPTRRVCVVVALLALAASAGPAAAATQVTHDSAGRPITFDVRALGADVAGYTGILDGLLQLVSVIWHEKRVGNLIHLIICLLS